MNTITLTGLIRNIQYSHTIGDVDYNRADLLVKRPDGTEDVIDLRFKKFSNKYTEGKEISIVGNVRTYSKQLVDNKNKVNVYVFTYMDKPEDSCEENNICNIDGRICKIGNLEKTPSGKSNLHFILANNISTKGNQRLNSYIPCVAWGKTALEMENLQVGDLISISGQLHSREYKKHLDNGEIEIKIAHEVVVLDYKMYV